MVDKVEVEDVSAFPDDDDDGTGPGSPPPPCCCWAKEVEETRSDYTCDKTVATMCRSYGIREEDYRPLCAQGGRGPCRTPPEPEASNALCVFEAMLQAGVRFPLHSLYSKVLTHLGLAPSQLTPNAWRYLAGFVLLCDGVGVRPMAAVFRHYFKLRAHGGSLQGFYHLEPSSNNNHVHDRRRLFKLNGGRLPYNNYGWKKRFFFLVSNKPCGCPREWGVPKTKAYAKPELTDVESKAIGKLEAEKAKRDGIHLLDLLDKSQYENSFPVLPALPTATEVKAEEGSHDPSKRKRMCLVAPGPIPMNPITGGTAPPHELAIAAMAPSPPGFAPVLMGMGSSSSADDDGELSTMVCKLIQDREGELRHAKQQLRVERAERADQVSRLQNDVTQLEMEKHKNMAEARRSAEDLEAAKAEHAKTAAEMSNELKLREASHVQSMTKLTRERDADRFKARQLTEELEAEKDRHVTVERQLREDLEAAQAGNAKALVVAEAERGKARRLAQELEAEKAMHAAEMNATRQQYQRKVISAGHMSGTAIGELLRVRYAQGLRDMRDLVLVEYPDVDPAKLTPEALTAAATSVQAASPLQL